MNNIDDLLNRPARSVTPGSRAVSLLGRQEEACFATLTMGDLIYDRISIEPTVLQAFDFAHSSNVGDIYELARWSHDTIGAAAGSYEGAVNRLQGYVFERMAALALRHSGAVVEFPEYANNPAYDFLLNGEPVQAKCGLSPVLVSDHLHRHPDIMRVVVNEDLASHFPDNDHIIAIAGVTRDSVRAATEHGLNDAADMLELHLSTFIPVITIARNAFALWRGDTDWGTSVQNVGADLLGRFTGASAAHAVGGVLAAGLGGWPAIILPVFATCAGYRGGRGLSDWMKKSFLLRVEYATVASSLQTWCGGAARVLTQMIDRAGHTGDRIVAARERAHPDMWPMLDDWQRRLSAEQDFRRLHQGRFARGSSDITVFDQGAGLLKTCAAAMLAAPRAGLVPADLSPERHQLVDAIDAYEKGLRRYLLSPT